MKKVINIIKSIGKACKENVAFSFAKSAALCVMLFTLTACPVPPGMPRCVEADDWSGTVNLPLRVPANQEMTYSGISVLQGEPIKIRVGGLIDLCANDTTYQANTYDLQDSSGNDIAQVQGINARNSHWQPAAYRNYDEHGNLGALEYKEVEEGEAFSITVDGYYNDRNDRQEDGRGLYVYIGDTPPEASTNPGNNGAWWYGENGRNIPADNRLAGEGSAFPEFFELYDNGTTGGGGFSGIAPRDGKIWFRYARTASARGTSDGANKFSPWLGYYAWEDHRCDACRQATILSTCTAVAAALPLAYGAILAACITAWESSCAGTGHLEELVGAERDSGRHCRQHYSSNHWVYNDYGGSNVNDSIGKQPNSGGYNITIGTGCPGTYGRFMEMHIGNSQARLVQETIPNGCIIGRDDPCDIVRDSWSGIPVMVPEFTVPGANVTNMDLRGRGRGWVPTAGYQRPGHFELDGNPNGVPATGELWFRINDNVTSENYPPGYYADNHGSYRVEIETTEYNTGFSDFLQKVVNPVRGFIFGYCKVPPTTSVNTIGGLPQYRPAENRYDIPEANCNTVYEDYNGDSHRSWQSGITQRMYHQLVGGSSTCIEDSAGECLKDENGDPLMGATIGNPFLETVRAALVLYVVLYGGLFMLGMVETKQEDFLKRIIKIAVIAVLFSNDSWNFFSQYLFSAFVDGTNEMITILTSNFTGGASAFSNDPMGNVTTPAPGNLFAFADMTVNRFFHKSVWIKIAGLLFSSPIGFIYIGMILAGLWLFIMSILKAMILYLLASLAVALLLIVAPIYISFMLFDRTKPLFDKWVKSLFNYALQPVLVLTALAIFNVFIYSTIYVLLYYRVCWGTVYMMTIDLLLFEIPSFPFINFYRPAAPFDLSMPIGFFVFLIYIIVCQAMLKFVDWMADLTSELTVGHQLGSLAQAADKAFKSVVDNSKKATKFGLGTAKSVGKGAAKYGAKGAKAGGKAAIRNKARRDAARNFNANKS